MKSGLKFVALALCLSIAPWGTAEAASAKKSTKRDQMSAEQKKALRQRAREYCAKKYAKGKSQIERIEIKSNGSVVCWIRE
jgi:lipopolysaccharide export LptBFGC system permease protein LptF